MDRHSTQHRQAVCVLVSATCVWDTVTMATLEFLYQAHVLCCVVECCRLCHVCTHCTYILTYVCAYICLYVRTYNVRMYVHTYVSLYVTQVTYVNL